MMQLVFMLADVAVAALLVAVIVYCRNLNSNIRVLQDSRSEMAKLFAEFDQSIERASTSIYELKEAAKKSDVLLKEKLDTANMIADDLSFMIERGNKMADQLETGLKGGRNALSAKESATGGMAISAKQTPGFDSEPAPKSASRAEASSRNTASLESVLEQMAGKNPVAAPKPAAKQRSKAEQELLDSLKTGGRQ